MCFGSKEPSFDGEKSTPPCRPVEVRPTNGSARQRSSIPRPAPSGNATKTSDTQTRPRKPSPPYRTWMPLTEEARAEFLTALHDALGNIPYGVIGGCALAEYGIKRKTLGVDIMVPDEVADVIEKQVLAAKGFVRAKPRGLGYVFSNEYCYGLDIFTDKSLNQTLQSDTQTQTAPETSCRSPTAARIATMPLLLNSKAYAFMTRTGPDADEDRVKDANDIIYILRYMKQHRISADRRECRWAVDYDFRAELAILYPSGEAMLESFGLSRDVVPKTENRSERERGG